MADILLMIMLICMLGGFIFTVSGILNLFKTKPAKDEWKRALIFYVLAVVSFVLFGLSI